MNIPGFERTLMLPAEKVCRLLNGVEVEVRDQQKRGLTHRARAHPPGATSYMINRGRGDGLSEWKKQPYPESAYCRPCDSFVCEGARYALAVLPKMLDTG